MAKLQFIPSPAIDGFYTIVNTATPKLINTKIGNVDLSLISKVDADRLFEAGTDYLKKALVKKRTKKEESS